MTDDQAAFGVAMLEAVRRVAEAHEQHVAADPQAVVRVVDAVARAAMAIAVSVDPEVTGLLAHISAADGMVVVSVRKPGNNDVPTWQELEP